MERLARALSIIIQGMLRNNHRHATDSVNEATEVLGGMLNTHKSLLESGVEIQKRLESHATTKKMGIFQRPRSASLRDIPKNQAKGEKRAAPYPLRKKVLRAGKAACHPRMLRWLRARPRLKKGTGKWSRRRAGKKRKKEGEGPCAKSTGNCRQTEVEALHARQVGRRHRGVGKGRPVLHRHLQGNEGEGRSW